MEDGGLRGFGSGLRLLDPFWGGNAPKVEQSGLLSSGVTACLHYQYRIGPHGLPLGLESEARVPPGLPAHFCRKAVLPGHAVEEAKGPSDEAPPTGDGDGHDDGGSARCQDARGLAGRSRVQDELRGEGGDEGPEGVVAKGKALGPGTHQSDGESGPAETAAGLCPHLRGEVQAHRRKPPVGHLPEQMPGAVGQFQYRPLREQREDRRTPRCPLPPGYDPGDRVVGPGKGTVKEAEEKPQCGGEYAEK